MKKHCDFCRCAKQQLLCLQIHTSMHENLLSQGLLEQNSSVTQDYLIFQVWKEKDLLKMILKSALTQFLSESKSYKSCKNILVKP